MRTGRVAASRVEALAGTLAPGLLALLFAVAPAGAQTQVARTLHNLTPSGPGTFRVTDPAGVCVFCHTPHNANPTRALWNRELPGVTYRVYESTTLGALPGQPTGASRLCLSCHDGTLALGSVRVGGTFTLGPLTGRGVLGTDLSDDHPVSFAYDAALAARNAELADPAALPGAIRLDQTGQLQCTSCHDPHEDRRIKFLRLDTRFSALCTACHRRRDWAASSHATSAATWSGAGTNPWPHTPYTTVAENGCESCHRPHAAGLPARLLNYAREEENCAVCHNGAVAQKDVAAQFARPSRHPIADTQGVHDPTEDPFAMTRHVECQDCHNPHVVDGTPASPPLVSGRLRRVSGVSASGTRVTESTYQYEICYKCHGLREQPSPVVVRLDHVTNVRLEYDPANPSFHPVVAPGKNPNVPSLMPPYTTSSQIFCADCHGSDSPTTGGVGPHGSTFAPILAGSHPLVGPPVTESAARYELCYGCHDRTSLLDDRSEFRHRKHVEGADTPCAVCHDAHGSRTYPHLINFMLRDGFGATVVQPNQDGRLEFEDRGVFRGACYLLCHGRDHRPEEYP